MNVDDQSTLADLGRLEYA